MTGEGRKMNLKSISLLLLPAAFMLLLVACGDTQPLPDIDATVEARVEVAKDSLVAPTAAPLPTISGIRDNATITAMLPDEFFPKSNISPQ